MHSRAPETFVLDGEELPFTPGETIPEAATRAGHWIPHLCWREGFAPHGSCRVCAVKVGTRTVAACSTRITAEMEVDTTDNALAHQRKALLQMLFVEGNHFCPSCEKSGQCQLQATAYAAGVEGPHFEELYPDRPIDASHPDLLLDFNRCILCGLCVRASQQRDGKSVFALGGHGIGSHLLVNSPSGRLVDSGIAPTDEAAHICPVGVILHKRRGFAVPIGQRRYDQHPISAEAGDDAIMAPTLHAPRKLKVATVSLAGCFGCHMSLLDIDERLLTLIEKIEFDRSPLTDIKQIGHCDIGLIEGGLCNAENVHVLREFRAHCKTLVAVGACAITGGLPARRNHLDLGRMLTDVYRQRPGLAPGAAVPNDPELPLPLNRVHPLHEVVHIDYSLPGCPPSADAFWQFLTDLIAGRTPHLGHGLLRYD